MYSDLKGKTVMITGANRGLGEGIAEGFAQAGCRLVLVYREEKPKVSGGDPVFIQSDINDTAKISNWLSEFEKSGNHVDILVNNAGEIVRKPLLETDEADWQKIFETNLKGTFFLSQLLAKHMAKQSKGIIINSASYGATTPSAFFGIYAASKAALVTLTKSMAAEWAPQGIRVNSYSPGVIETRMTADGIKRNKEAVLSRISLNRLGTKEEVANAVLFLASDQSSYVTGTDLDVSGGKLLIQNPDAPWE